MGSPEGFKQPIQKAETDEIESEWFPENGVDSEELRAVQSETTIDLKNLSVSVDTTEQRPTPEELKEKRLAEIRREIEQDWTAKNGPMERQRTQAEVKKLQDWMTMTGGEGEVKPTVLTDAANEFWFDHKGGGENSVPKQAERILRERFPEYADVVEVAASERSNSNSSVVVDFPFGNQSSRPESQRSQDTVESLSQIFEEAGMKSEVVQVENGGAFPEIIIFEKNEAQTEKLVRLYRGIGHLDGSVLEQIPYAMRTEDDTGKPTTLEEVREEVETLAQHPTYENLVTYVNKVRLYLQPGEIQRLDDDLLKIEQGILDGYSTRKELMMRQIEHNGGWGDSGISPYISLSHDPYEAVGYGRSGLVVIDVPLSEIEDFRADTSEASFKGVLDKKYITAILPRLQEAGGKEQDQLNQDLYRALQVVFEKTSTPLYTNDELYTGRENKLDEDAESDLEQWKRDVEQIRQNRVASLTQKFPEVTLETQNVADRNVDVYSKAKRNIFDFYKARLEQIGRTGRRIEDYDYSERPYASPKKFDREKVDDTMLEHLRKLVRNLEEREERRQKAA